MYERERERERESKGKNTDILKDVHDVDDSDEVEVKKTTTKNEWW